jgi:ribulose bisphosphate carboxylase small subunit
MAKIDKSDAGGIALRATNAALIEKVRAENLIARHPKENVRSIPIDATGDRRVAAMDNAKIDLTIARACLSPRNRCRQSR